MICLLCRETVQLDLYAAHFNQSHSELKRELTKSVCLPFVSVKSFLASGSVYRLDLSDTDEIDVDNIFDYVQIALDRCVRSLKPPIRAKVLFKCKFSKANTDDEGTKSVITDDDVKFSTPLCEMVMPSNVAEAVDFMRDRINLHVENYNLNGSGYFLESILQVDLTLLKMGQIMAGGHLNAFPPHPISENVRSFCLPPSAGEKSNLCFANAVIAGLHKDVYMKRKSGVHHLLNASKYRDNFARYAWPDSVLRGDVVSIADVELFCKANNVGVRVYGFNDDHGVVIPIYVPEPVFPKYVHLMLYQDHYFLIPKMHLMYVNADKLRKRCPHCMIGFSQHKQLETHIKRCSSKRIVVDPPPAVRTFPEPRVYQRRDGTTVTEKPVKQFFRQELTEPLQFIGSFDFESILKPSEVEEILHDHEVAAHSTQFYFIHEKLMVVDETYVGPQALDNFIGCMLRCRRKADEIFDKKNAREDEGVDPRSEEEGPGREELRSVRCGVQGQGKW
jgi:hypothetical protein